MNTSWNGEGKEGETHLDAVLNWIIPLGWSLRSNVTVAYLRAGSTIAPELTCDNSITKVVSFSGT